MITNVNDAVIRLWRQFAVESAQNESVVTLLSGGAPHTPPNIAEIEAAVAMWHPFSLFADRTTIPADGVTAATITVRTSSDVAQITLLINATPATITLTNGAGTVQIARDTPTLPPHLTIKAQSQQTYGYNQIVIIAE